MIAVPFIGFAAVALLAIGFTTFTLWRHKVKGGVVLAAAIALFLLGVGGGTYWMLGRPSLAARDAQGLATRDVKGLVNFLIARVRKQPDDLQAWIYLGRAYMTVGDITDAAKAYGRAVTMARLEKHETPGLYAIYGEALIADSGGSVSDEAVSAFSAALKLDPRNPPARYFLGQARAERGDKKAALEYWLGLRDDIPPNQPLYKTLTDRIAMLRAGGGPAPDPRVMVANLAARLKTNPNDAGGWQRLIHAYTVLGQPADAKAALATARKTFANDTQVMGELEQEAKEMKLN